MPGAGGGTPKGPLLSPKGVCRCEASENMGIIYDYRHNGDSGNQLAGPLEARYAAYLPQWSGGIAVTRLGMEDAIYMTAEEARLLVVSLR